jgi:hypothetical protein
MAATAGSLLPMMEKLGVARACDVQIDSLAARLQQGLVESNATIVMPLMVGAWTRSPG